MLLQASVEQEEWRGACWRSECRAGAVKRHEEGLAGQAHQVWGALWLRFAYLIILGGVNNTLTE